MNATQLFITLVVIFVVLLVLALIKPYVFNTKTVSITDFKNELSRLLPSHDLLIKQGSQSRIIVSLDGIQKAIIVMDKEKAEYRMGGLPIFTTNKIGKLKNIADKINAFGAVMN